MGSLSTQLIIHSFEDCKVRIEPDPNPVCPYTLTFGDNQLVIRGDMGNYEDIVASISDEITRIKEEDNEFKSWKNR